jgi:hypothetical protein
MQDIWPMPRVLFLAQPTANYSPRRKAHGLRDLAQLAGETPRPNEKLLDLETSIAALRFLMDYEPAISCTIELHLIFPSDEPSPGPPPAADPRGRG